MWYGKVVSGEVVKIKTFDGPDAVLEQKLLAHGYLLGEDGEISFDPQTQVKDTEPIYDIQETKIVRTYDVKDKATTLYGKVEDAEVTNVKSYPCPAFVTQLVWLDDNGYLIINDGDSSYDSVTQTKATDPTYDIQAEQIVRTYAISDKSLADAKTAKLAWIRQQAQSTITSDYPGWFQDNVANGIYGSDVGDPMKAHIANIIIESNSCEDDVDSAETVLAVRNVTPAWPVE
jgi:hypothetical protein